MTRGVWLLVLSLFVFAVSITTIANANEQTGDLNQNTSDSTVDSNNVSTTNNYNGAGAASRETPPPSAIAPSYISNGPETCLVGSSIGTQVNVFGLSGGFYRQDVNCNRRRDAKVLKDLGMNIAAVALMCRDTDVWRSMFQSGTPCPITINGKLVVGRAAYYTMKKTQVCLSLIIKNKEYYDVTLKLEQTDEETTDSGLSISERFRTSIRRD